MSLEISWVCLSSMSEHSGATGDKDLLAMWDWMHLNCFLKALIVGVVKKAEKQVKDN